jgi:putative membrane protein
MRAALRIILQTGTNALAIYLAMTFVIGFSILPPLLLRFSIVVIIFTLLNIFLKPLFKILFGPLILVTFGLFTIVINGLLLFILDSLSKSVTIQGFGALLGGAILVSILNLGMSLLLRTLRIRK